MEWSQVPAWIEAVATVGALLAAGAAAFYAHRTLGVELGRDQARAEEEQAAQADLVAAWVTGSAVRTHGGVPLRLRNLTVVIFNQSPLPVYDLEIRVHTPRRQLGTQAHPIALPNENEVVWTGGGREDDDPVDPNEYRVAIDFRDAAGRLWTRDERGSLSSRGRVVYGQGSAHVKVATGGGAGTVTPPP